MSAAAAPHPRRPADTVTAGGPFSWAGAVLLLFFVAAVLAPWLIRLFDRSAIIALALLPAATTVWAAVMVPAALDGGHRALRISWIPTLGLTLDLRWDALSAVLTLVVAGIGTLVMLYSARYFPAGDDGAGRYTGALLAFAGAMLGLVLADNLFLLLVCWELTGMLSYLLIALRTGKQSARKAASQAFIVTTAGGLAMLIGAVMIGVQAGTYRISEILAAPPTGAIVHTGVVLLLVGGLSKSAIFPFQFWLPGAMAAPTPASAYLHAATMVKAGIYLFARFAPAFAGLGAWQPVLIGLGAITMLYGAVQALRQRDLKLLLAYGTVSQLGLMTVVLGVGTPDALLAGLALLIGHASFKAALFFVVGIIDTGTGTRDLTMLSGLGRQRPVLLVTAVLAAVSMAGIPPMIGFVTKEAALAATTGAGTAGAVATVVIVVGSALTVAYSARFLWGAFATKSGVAPTRIAATPLLMTAPTQLLVVLGLAAGIVPGVLEGIVQSYAGTAGQTHTDALALWHGFTLALGLSALAWLVGAAVYLGQRAAERRRTPARPGNDPGTVYRWLTGLLEEGAARFTGLTHRGSLPSSMGAILLVLIVFPGSMLIASGAGPAHVIAWEEPAEAVIALIVIVLAVMTLRSKRGLTAVLLVGGIGYAVAVLFVLRGAPDLALTQILVETVTLVAALLVLRRLPDTALYEARPGNRVRAVLAVGVGALMTAVALILPGSRVTAPISTELTNLAVEYGGGSNVVNVILVDTRGWDTFGEILVLVAAATGVASLVFLQNRTGAAPRRPSAEAGNLPKPNSPTPWLRSPWVPRRSLLLEVVTRLIFHTVVIFSVYVLFVGHDQPGGGFAGGLIVGLALTLRYIAGGAFELGEAAPWDVGAILGAGIVLAVGTAAGGLFFGGDVLQSVILKADVPLLGEFKFVTSSLFDIGVYLVVIGMVLDVLRSLGAGIDRIDHFDTVRAPSTRRREVAR
ncbi:Na+/H+ antiporter subunit A [Nakamurella sp. YIM 132087]|uniref:Na+/H+ antiporter subunit A n=1 Tax=Nakamurella alba TaxID=2665158 RepID=A0A7K1FGL1_9ACTN|nr:Na+/H+ antiporter subunit A [Nakamurella alba]MTD13265.1 Na+/H+ antiporter subunit A [Nakamurella alba]